MKKLTPALKKAAKSVRNAARRCSCQKRTEKAKSIFQSAPVWHVHEDGTAWANWLAGNGYEVYLVKIGPKGRSCDCPDAKRGHLCKHQRALAALVIKEAADQKEGQRKWMESERKRLERERQWVEGENRRARNAERELRLKCEQGNRKYESYRRRLERGEGCC